MPPKRPTCSVFIATSLDGFIARPDGALDWLERFERSGEDYGYQAFFEGVDALVVGRKTYDFAAGLDRWPYASKRCVVLTHRPPAAKRAGEEFLSGTAGELAERLGREGVRRAYVDGGAVIRQFLADGLIDDLTLSVIPVLLGAGIRLFDTGLPECWLTLTSTRSWPSGLVQVSYGRAAVEPGALGAGPLRKMP